MLSEKERQLSDRLEPLADLKLYSLTEIQGLVGVSRKTLYRHARSGKLKAVKVADAWRVREADLRRYLEGEA